MSSTNSDKSIFVDFVLEGEKKLSHTCAYNLFFSFLQLQERQKSTERYLSVLGSSVRHMTRGGTTHTAFPTTKRTYT